MKILIVYLCFVCVLLIQSCIPNEIEIVDTQDVDQLPQFPGGTWRCINFPGTLNGKKERVSFILPIKFVL